MKRVASTMSRSSGMDSGSTAIITIPIEVQEVPIPQEDSSGEKKEDEQQQQSQCCGCQQTACCSQHMKVIRRAPSVLWIPVLAFVALAGTGLAIILTTANSERVDAKEEAETHATEAGRWFATQLDRAVTPVFSLAQFMTELEDFDQLPDEIGAARETGSLQFLPEPTQDGVPTHRNTTGSKVKSPAVVDRFNRIASRIKKNANMKGILVNLQVAPKGVLALSYPLNNTEDFREGAFLDSSTIIGYDLLSTPNRRVGAEAAIRAKNTIVFIGPIALHQCRAGAANVCDPVVDQAFIARLNVPSERHEILLSDGTVEESWGFAAGIINWYALVQQSLLYEQFAASGREFLLTNWQAQCGAAGDGCTKFNVKELAKTPGFDHMGPSWLTVTVKLDNRTMNDWEMTVGYPDPTSAWFPAAMAAVIVLSFAMAVLVYFLLHQKQLLSTMEEQEKALELLKKKRAMDKKLKEAYAMIEAQKKKKGNVGLVSSMRKIGRLEEELADVENDMEGLERYVDQRRAARRSNRRKKKADSQEMDASDACTGSTASRTSSVGRARTMSEAIDLSSSERRSSLDGGQDASSMVLLEV